LGGDSKGQILCIHRFPSIAHSGLFLLRDYNIDKFLEMQKHMGEDVTVSAIRWQFAVPIRADAKRLQEARAAGIDCQTIVLSGPGGGFKGVKSRTILLSLFILPRTYSFHFKYADPD
jgi:poly-beta-hydroxyalkanoate depolymerase